MLRHRTMRNPLFLCSGVFLALMLVFAPAATAQEHAHDHDHPGADDPRVGLEAGYLDAAETAWGMELVSNTPRPDGFHDPANIGDLSVGNSDLAFQGNYVIAGNFAGFNIYDISNPESPRLRLSVICPGGQGDVSIYENLLFMSVEEARGRIDCGFQGTAGPVDPERFRGVRVFDLSDIDNPVQVAAVQTVAARIRTPSYPIRMTTVSSTCTIRDPATCGRMKSSKAARASALMRIRIRRFSGSK
jgi:hypothetical protein